MRIEFSFYPEILIYQEVFQPPKWKAEIENNLLVASSDFLETNNLRVAK